MDQVLHQRPPMIKHYGNVTVVREDMIPGGTKARFIDALFAGVDEVVYASPTQGGAQTALALAGKRLGKTVTLFVPASKTPHPRVLLSRQLGANIIQVPMGFLSNLQSQARRYTKQKAGSKIYNLEFGLGTQAVIDKIAQTARQIPRPDQLWCAAGSGTLARGLAAAWPDVPRFVVQVGHKLTPEEAAGATVIVYPRPYAYQERRLPPFPSDPTYERKAWWTMLDYIGNENATFWNAAASAAEETERV
jgi:1-aminocyclopropane-1-carboxylate deaminase/D-cysteine desulfhydrase-like pyridoxal-dependent ACC family enzyme